MGIPAIPAPPALAVRIGKPDINPTAGKIVLAVPALRRYEFESSRPIRYNRPIGNNGIRGRRHVKRNPPLIGHIGTIALGATSVTDLLLDTILTDGSIARSATTALIDVNHFFATIGTNEPMFGFHCKIPLVVRTR